MISSSSLQEGSRKKNIETEFYNQVISSISCCLRVKMKELTYNVTCNPAYEIKDYHHNMKIKIKRGDNDTTIEDCRQYMKRLILLVNRS
jgi:hypothetical protein